MRTASITRNTNETKITCSLEIDGVGKNTIDTGCGFLNHMLELFARHGRFDICLTCNGDTQVDDHHTVEDVGIVLGKAFSDALKNRAGIIRYGNFLLPMDETLILCAVDISGRPFLAWDVSFETEKIGTFDTQLVEEFFLAFTRTLGATIHFKKLDGKNSHHIAEACFKGSAKALRQAVAIDVDFADEIPSTKGNIL